MIFYTTCKRPLHSRTVFKNFKNQSQRSTPTFRNVKNQSAFYNHDASRMSIKQFEILFKTQCTTFKNQKNARVIKMDKKRLKIVLSVLDAVRGRFPETLDFVDSNKKLAQMDIFVLDLILKCLFFCLQMWKGLTDKV